MLNTISLAAILLFLLFTGGCSPYPAENAEQGIVSRDASSVTIVAECARPRSGAVHCATGSTRTERSGYRYEAPQVLNVLAGNAGSGRATLAVGSSRCEYHGGSRLRHPLRTRHAGEIERGQQYHLHSCSPERTSVLEEGEHIELIIERWDHTLPIQVEATIQIY